MKLFDNARLKLTGWYIIVISLISLTFSFVIYHVEATEIARLALTQRSRLEHRYGLSPGIVVIDQEVIDTALRRIITRLVLFNGIVLVLAGGVGYFLAGRTLSPIEQMVLEQRRFISDAAHELRTPLTSMMISMEVFERGKNPSLKEAMSVIKGNSQDVKRLQALINSLLTIAELKENGRTAIRKKVDLLKVAEKAITTLSPVFSKKKITLVKKFSPATVVGEEALLITLNTIILDNAIKYSPAKTGKIIYTVFKKNKSVIIQIKDNGIGIAKQDLPRIFDRFYRADSARTHGDSSGYGLGLSIAKQIVAAHQGKIQVTSQTQKGTTFTITLPSFSA